MHDSNKHIKGYLDYYCSMSSAPEFAILLKGEWGSGKTWFIKKYIEEQKERKFIYVSLYGMTSFSEIEDEFFRQLHPKLSSKGMRLTGKILKGILKTAIKVDLDDDGMDDASVSSQIPDVNFPEYLTDIDDHVLIFDDLERCKMDFENVLGYINHFVEHQNFKVIILAHEEELERRAVTLKIEYKLIKEKLIGKTFQVVPSLESAIDDFIGKLANSDASKFLLANKELIASVYQLSKFKNLRVLKQSLWDFERIYEALPEKAMSKEALVQKILSLSLAFSLETRTGNLSPDEILELQPDWLSAATAAAGNTNGDKSPPQKFIEKYKSLEPHRPIPEVLFWSEYLGKGVIEHAALSASIDNSIYFVNEVTPNWVKLWHFMDLHDDEFERALEAVKGEFESKVYTEIGVVKHVFGLLLWLSEIGLLFSEKRQIIATAQQYVDTLKMCKALPEETNGLMETMMGYSGLGFHGKDLPEFGEFSEYVKKSQMEAKQESMPQAANELIEIMRSDVKKFVRMIIVSNSDDQIYCNTPIFKYSDATKFVSGLLEIRPKDRRLVAYALEERYKFKSASLLGELDWLKEVSALLKAKADQMKGKLSGYALSAIQVEVNKVIGMQSDMGSASQ